jgi:hypothetical protein
MGSGNYSPEVQEKKKNGQSDILRQMPPTVTSELLEPYLQSCFPGWMSTTGTRYD